MLLKSLVIPLMDVQSCMMHLQAVSLDHLELIRPYSYMKEHGKELAIYQHESIQIYISSLAVDSPSIIFLKQSYI